MFFSYSSCCKYIFKHFNRKYEKDQSLDELEESTQEELEKDYDGEKSSVLNDIQALQKYEVAIDSNFAPCLKKYTFRICEGYIWIEKRHKNLYDPRNNVSNGWKIHISILNDDIPKAWPIIIRHLIKNGVMSFKISNITDLVNKQHGKEGVIYYFASSTQIDWQCLLNSIEIELRNAAVKPNVNPPKFRPKGSLVSLNIEEPSINGSRYFYCTNDGKDEQAIHNKPKDLGPFKEIYFNNHLNCHPPSSSL